MKLKKIFYLTFLFFIALFIWSENSTLTSKASTKPSSISIFPKQMRGYWYASDGKSKYYMGKKVFEYKNGKHVQKLYLHNLHQQKKYPIGNASLSKKSPTINWLYAYQFKYHGMNWINALVWNSGAGDGTFYNFSKHNGHQVLSTAYGAGIWGTQHYYRSFKLAKQFMHKRYPHYSYYED
ncbi:hypothetical protein DY120_04175 [Apilactobacillus micheneri]|uniref:Uncharacterized protein n=1 Tax=Apilactobacillus micheneri TaxID=1899430 RepID=A0ABY2YVX2_9LACO|nr:hypothetical protein [Apilactobacillus micheneri]TPR24484.1 hypothetical protein DY114_04175 [Apilactobacillus micheneri]TPR25795.1 hypothetical protein DY111_04175 [Apilactobacillus micheneri]TPR27985.1 hypothetical protein DY113_02120 [Apilactobacillus micheneri]TPR29476.1 hypothetical protein DY117_04175 [Apilactobacillus micheneri]TPR30262.1 hypothetical protein DY120_04175 [Apilactobacillus micheneri]